jgi:hypothetical protein
MPSKRKHARYHPPKKQDVTYMQISHDIAEKAKKGEKEGVVQEM